MGNKDVDPYIRVEQSNSYEAENNLESIPMKTMIQVTCLGRMRAMCSGLLVLLEAAAWPETILLIQTLNVTTKYSTD